MPDVPYAVRIRRCALGPVSYMCFRVNPPLGCSTISGIFSRSHVKRDAGVLFWRLQVVRKPCQLQPSICLSRSLSMCLSVCLSVASFPYVCLFPWTSLISYVALWFVYSLLASSNPTYSAVPPYFSMYTTQAELLLNVGLVSCSSVLVDYILLPMH